MEAFWEYLHQAPQAESFNNPVSEVTISERVGEGDIGFCDVHDAVTNAP